MRYKKNVGEENCILQKKSTNSFHFFIRVISFNLLIKNVFMKINNSIFPPKYTRYGKNYKKQDCLFQKDLNLGPENVSIGVISCDY